MPLISYIQGSAALLAYKVSTTLEQVHLLKKIRMKQDHSYKHSEKISNKILARE